MLSQSLMGGHYNSAANLPVTGNRTRQERYQINQGKIIADASPRNRDFAADKNKLIPTRRTKASKIRTKWRSYINTIRIGLYMSKKYRLLKLARKPKPFIEILTDKLQEKMFPIAQSLKDQIKELSSEGADFLLKDGLLLFSRRPSKTQTQKFASIINGFVELSCNVSFRSKKSIDLLRRLLSGDGLPRSYFWDNEQSPPLNDIGKAILLVYYVFVKCIIAKIILKSDPEMTELEEHNLRALALTLFRIARQVGSDSPVEVDSQFKKAIQSFSRTADENVSFNKLLFKTFATEIKHNVAKLNAWAISEIQYEYENAKLSQNKEQVIRGNQEASPISEEPPGLGLGLGSGAPNNDKANDINLAIESKPVEPENQNNDIIPEL